MSIKVVYDYQAFALNPYGGISRYLYEVSKIINQNEDCETKIVAPLYNNQYLRNLPSNMIVGKSYDQLQDLLGLTSFFNRKYSEYWLKNNPPNILHETYYDKKGLAPSGVKTILTVHDMIHEKFHYSMNRSEKDVVDRKRKAIERVDKVICVSENTKQDLLNSYNIDPQKISIVYHGCSLSVNADISTTPFINYPYLLYVGARGYYKNFQNLLKAYAVSHKISCEFKLVCFGGGTFSKVEKSLINNLKIDPNKIIYFEGNDQLLVTLYNGAKALIYPSLYEGFGIPPLEAMQLNCPVICSNAGSIPEVVGDAGQYFDPHNIEEMASAIESVVFSEDASNNLISKGLERASLFSWTKCAQETYKIYEDLVN